MPSPAQTSPAFDELTDVVDQSSPRYGVVTRDIFSEGRWSLVEPVRARDWNDVARGTSVASSETAFD